MVKKIFYLLTTWSCLYLVYGHPPNLKFCLQLTKDTIFIGEPMIIKCMLINNSGKPINVYGAPSRPLLTCGKLSFSLNLPGDDREFWYGVGYLVLTENKPPNFVLSPHDSIYWYSILNWRDWSYRIQKKDVANLPIGTYRIKAEYFLDSDDLSQHWRISSNVDSFYAEPMLESESEKYNEICQVLNNYFIFIIGRDECRMIQENFPKYLEIKNSIIAQFCHYILAMSSPLPKRIAFCKSFLEKYPNTPLAEEIEFCLAEAYIGIGRKDLSTQAYRLALRKFPDNINGYYYRNLRQKFN